MFMTHFPDQKLSLGGGITDGDSQDLFNRYNYNNTGFMGYIDR
jgi:hypothetical protein